MNPAGRTKNAVSHCFCRRTLATVAVEDEGWSDYEIVKRLEFSKRLTTAFLEHAQVIAKFKRYPHRNAAHDRTFTLEERI